MTRLNEIYTRVWLDGYSICQDVISVGDYGVQFEAPLNAALCDGVKNATLGRGSVKCGPFNAFLAPSATTGLYELAKDFTTKYHNVLIADGATAVPTQGDPCFAARVPKGEVKIGTSPALVALNIAFPEAAYAGALNYAKPLGYLLHGETAETAVNTAPGIDDNNATASAKGGVWWWHLLSSNGTVTLKAQDATASNLDASFSDITGATSGVQDATTTPASGFIQLATDAAVRKYLRWQLVFGTANTATFVCAFMRQL